nr:hypothetical protein Iba_chr11fCG4140 [Ipomoea batatas]
MSPERKLQNICRSVLRCTEVFGGCELTEAGDRELKLPIEHRRYPESGVMKIRRPQNCAVGYSNSSPARRSSMSKCLKTLVELMIVSKPSTYSLYYIVQKINESDRPNLEI